MSGFEAFKGTASCVCHCWPCARLGGEASNVGNAGKVAVPLAACGGNAGKGREGGW
jgi:hypothetical protein